MATSTSTPSLIVGGTLLALFLLQLPGTLLWRQTWRPATAFAAAGGAVSWLPWAYTLFLILWLPLSCVATANALQDGTLETFIMGVVLIPLCGAAIAIGLVEAATGVSPRLGWRWRRHWLRTSLDVLREERVEVCGPSPRVRTVGLLRVALAAAIIALSYVVATHV